MAEATAPVAPAAGPVEAPQNAPVPTVVPSTPPAPAAPQMPATPAVEAPAADEKAKAELAAKEAAAKAEEKGQFGAKVTYAPTGNPHLDAAVNFFGGLGLDLETLPGYQQAAQGDFGLIRAHLATLGIPGAEAYVALAEAGFKARQEVETQKTQAIQALILETEGGDGTQWAEALNWVRENTEDAPEQREQLNSLLGMGGLATKLAADFIMGQYRAQPGVSTAARKSAVNPNNASAGAPVTTGPLSASEYSKAVEQLRRTNPGQEIEGSDQLAQLRARREAGRRAGR